MESSSAAWFLAVGKDTVDWKWHLSCWRMLIEVQWYAWTYMWRCDLKWARSKKCNYCPRLIRCDTNLCDQIWPCRIKTHTKRCWFTVAIRIKTTCSYISTFSDGYSTVLSVNYCCPRCVILGHPNHRSLTVHCCRGNPHIGSWNSTSLFLDP